MPMSQPMLISRTSGRPRVEKVSESQIIANETGLIKAEGQQTINNYSTQSRRAFNL